MFKMIITVKWIRGYWKDWFVLKDNTYRNAKNLENV